MVAFRSREDGDIGTKTIEEFIKEVQEEKERRDKQLEKIEKMTFQIQCIKFQF